MSPTPSAPKRASAKTAAPLEAEAKPNARLQKLAQWALVALVIGVFVRIGLVDGARVLGALGNWPALLAGLALNLAVAFAMGCRWASLSSSSSYVRHFEVVMAGSFLSLAGGSLGGDVGRVLLHPNAGRGAAMSVLVDRILGVGSALFVALVGSLLFAPRAIALLLFGGIVGLAALAPFLALFRPAREALAGYRRNPRRLVIASAWAVANALLTVFVLWCQARWVGVSLPFGAATWIVPVAITAGFLSFLPLGAGASQLSFGALFIQAGIGTGPEGALLATYSQGQGLISSLLFGSLCLWHLRRGISTQSSAARLARLFVRAVPRKYAKLRVLRRVFPALSAQTRAVEIGPSHGGFASYYATRGRWTFVDEDEQNTQIAKELLRGDFHEGDALEYLRSAREIELVTCIDTIMYFDDPRNFLRLVHDSLVPGGRLVLSAINRPAADGILAWRERIGVESAMGYRCNPGPDEMVQMLEAAKLRVVSRTDYTGPVVEIVQTLVDKMSIAKGRAGANRLTYRFGASRAGWRMPVAYALLPISWLLAVVDERLFPRRRYSYLLVAERVA